MTNITKYILIITLLSNTLLANSQEDNRTVMIDGDVISSRDQIDLNNVNTAAIEEFIFENINIELQKSHLNTIQKHDFFEKVSKDQAKYMANILEKTSEQETKNKSTLPERLTYYGGSKIGEELIEKKSLSKSGVPLTYGKLADDIVFGWFSSSKKAELFQSGSNTYIGIGADIDNEAKKVYIAVTLGNYKSFNEGAVLRDKLPIPYSTKTYGLNQKDPSFCRKIDRSKTANELYDGLSVENNEIFIEVDNIKTLSRIIRKSKDGLAIDILQKEQFACGNSNIVDHNQFQQGIITKKLYSNKLFKDNLANTEENPKAFKTKLGELPEDLSNGYELNLIIIQNKSMCRSISKSFIIQTSGTYTRNVKLLADTVTINSRFKYKPVADSMSLSLRIPFEKNKSTYETKDIEPFIKLLNEPEFFIYDMNITAYSSLEGSDKENKKLQEERAQSIIDALKQRQRDSINTSIQTEYNWDIFKQDITKTKHNIMASMQIDEAQTYIRTYKLEKELEPIFEKQRYAQIDMKVTFDISGENEMPFVLKKINEAIVLEDLPLSLSIQKYIMKQVLNGRYPTSVLNNIRIPEEEQFAGMLMNSYWLKHKKGTISDEELTVDVKKLKELSPKNEYISFNEIYLEVDNETTDANSASIQAKIDRLYYSHLPKTIVDGLNIKYQFKLINLSEEGLTTKNPDELKSECIDRIKTIVDIRDESMENSLKLAELFIDNKDYSFGLKTLEPWLEIGNSNETLIFAYISLCSQFEEKMHSQRFNYAMKHAQAINPERYCKLFNGEFFSLKIFENTEIKKSYCKYCSEENSVVER